MPRIGRALAQPAVPRAAPPVRTPRSRLTVGPSDDPLEREADRVANTLAPIIRADHIASGGSADNRIRPAPPASHDRAGVSQATTKVQRKEASPAAGPRGGALDQATESRIRLATGGQPIDQTLRPKLEGTLDADLSNVRLHADSRLAPEIGAAAFTVGHDIHFAPGAYQPGTDRGQHLLGHELAHVAQQSSGSGLQRMFEGDTIIRRRMLDDEHLAEFDEIDVAKREARLSDLEGERLVSGRQSNGKLEMVFGARQAQNDAVEQRSQDVAKTDAANGVSGKNLGRLDAFVGAKQAKGADHDPVQAAADTRDAKARVKAGQARLAKELTAARTHAGTDYESAEVTQFDTQLAAQNWIAADAALQQVASVSKAKLASVRSRLVASTADIKKIATFATCHQPTTFNETGKACQTAIAEKDWIEAERTFKSLASLISLAKSFDERLKDVQTQTDALTEPPQQKNMVTWIAEHKAMTWDQVVATEDKTSPKGALGNLEARLKMYATNAGAAAASAKRAADLRQHRITEGLVTAAGQIIEQRTIADFAGEERASIQDGLDAIAAGAPQVLSHPNGAKFNEPHKNRDGDLPGKANGGGYKEYYLERNPADPPADYHGARRLVRHNKTGRIYYSWTHYGANGNPPFVRIQ